MVEVCIHNKPIGSINASKYEDVISFIYEKTQLNATEYFLEQNGRLVGHGENIDPCSTVHCILRLFGGKGGFGSMLRAIGAQIEKTTNREACRDLSGRRLRDINEEKRLKAWLEKQGEREREVEDRKKKKIEKLLAKPKHDFKDKEYEETRSKLAEKVNDAVEEGFKKELKAKKYQVDGIKKPDLKRKNGLTATASTNKKKKLDLWIGSDVSGTDSSDEEINTSDSNEKLS